MRHIMQSAPPRRYVEGDGSGGCSAFRDRGCLGPRLLESALLGCSVLDLGEPPPHVTVALPVFVFDTLARHCDDHPPAGDMVWTTQRGDLLQRGSFGRIWRRAVAESVGPPCRVHDLRHTHAAWLIADGEHPKAIQARLGHSSITVTMDRYGHLMDGLDDEIAAHLDTRAAAAAPPPRPEARAPAEPTDPQTRRNP